MAVQLQYMIPSICNLPENHEFQRSLSETIVLIVLEIPLLAGQNSAWMLLSVVGLMIESIIAMTVYSLVIEKKYKKSR